ncbi:MAG: serine/threonine-protein kinase [Kofleriaceae bacterium]
MSERDVPTVSDTTSGETRPARASELPTRLGHFEIVGRLGEGGMGLVFEARDSVLGRRVALKLLHPATSGGVLAPARLLREAQALAKLSHPNVVTVYEVGAVGDDQFIAMELVEGVTLLEWMATPRDWRAVLDVFIAVGHGLAAVHALGLVHRDFKPSNVLVDMRGVPKLGDFGLVGAIDDPDAPAPVPVNASDPGLTTPGTVMGTPAYMAPEQKRGEPVDARADQFSFAKSLREAMLPASLEPILARAMSDEPDDRYPTMDALLADLSRARRGRARVWVAAGVVTVVIVVVIAAWIVGRSSKAAAAEDPCARPTVRMAAVWGEPRRSALESHLATIDPVFGKQRFALAAPVLDRGAERWQELQVEACQMTKDGRQSSDLLDRRMTCLDRALFELGETAGALERATDGKTLDRAQRAATVLPTLEACADVEVLRDQLPLPKDPLKRGEINALAREIINIDVTVRTSGTRTGAVDRARGAVELARTLGDSQSLAAALRALAAIHHENEHWVFELATLREAAVAAADAHDDRMSAELASKQLAALISAENKKEAAGFLPAADAANTRFKAVDLKSAFVAQKARLLAMTKHVPEARALLDALIAEVTAAKLTSQALALRRTRADVAEIAQEFPTMESEMRALIPLFEEAYGKDHPEVGEAHRALGVAMFKQRRFPEAELELREDVRIGESRLGPSPRLARSLYELGSALYSMQRIDDARDYLTRAYAMAVATMPTGDWRLGRFLIGIGTVSDDQPVAQANNFKDGLAHLETGPRPNIQIATVLNNLAILERDHKNWDAAIALLKRALSEHEDIGGPDHTNIALVLGSMAECEFAARRFPAAIERSARAMKEPAHPVIQNMARYTHGMARAKSGDQGGLAEAAAAKAALVKFGAPVPKLE